MLLTQGGYTKKVDQANISALAYNLLQTRLSFTSCWQQTSTVNIRQQCKILLALQGIKPLLASEILLYRHLAKLTMQNRLPYNDYSGSTAHSWRAFRKRKVWRLLRVGNCPGRLHSALRMRVGDQMLRESISQCLCFLPQKAPVD